MSERARGRLLGIIAGASAGILSHHPLLGPLTRPSRRDAIMAALDKSTGEVIWKCAMPDIGGRGKDGAGYCSIVPAEIDGVRQYLTIVGCGAIGVEAATGWPAGTLRWELHGPPQRAANARRLPAGSLRSELRAGRASSRMLWLGRRHSLHPKAAARRH